MRTAIDLAELMPYSVCPERERRRKLDPHPEPPVEARYRSNLRKLLVRYYSELMEGNPMTLAQVRRAWSTMWDFPIQQIAGRNWQKSNSSFLNGLLTDDERVCLRGAEMIFKLLDRPLHVGMEPVIVDEPFTYDLDGFTLTGRLDLVFKDRFGHYWIVDWSEAGKRYAVEHDKRHAVLLAAFTRHTGYVARGVIVDYICTIGDYLDYSKRTPEQLQAQLHDAANIVRAISLELVWKNQGAHCKECPYYKTCTGAKRAKPKRSPGRPRKPVNGRRSEQPLS